MLTRLVRWLDLDERGGGLALPKVLALVVIALAGADAWRVAGLTWVHATLLITALAAASGRNAFKLWLSRVTVGVQGTHAVTTNVADTVRALREDIASRRDAADGIERPPRAR